MFKERKSSSVVCSALHLARALAGVVMLLIPTAYAEQTTKLFINKAQNPQNFIVLKNDVENTIKYTTDGIELEFPGIDVVLRCTSSEAASSAADECAIYIKESSVVTQDPPADDPPADDPPADDPPADDPPADDPPADDPPANDPATGSCTNGNGKQCTGLDIGPSGVAYSSQPVTIPEATILVYELKTKNISAGQVLANPNQSTGYGSANNAKLRQWISTQPGSRQLVGDNSRCGATGSSGKVAWKTTGSGCVLAPQTTYYYHFQECVSASNFDTTCSQLKEPSDNKGQYNITN